MVGTLALLGPNLKFLGMVAGSNQKYARWRSCGSWLWPVFPSASPSRCHLASLLNHSRGRGPARTPRRP